MSVFCQGSGEMPGFLSTADRGVSKVWGRRVRERRCAAEAWFTCAVGSRAAVLALSLDLLQTSFPQRSTVPTAKQNREERNVQNSTPVLTTERAVSLPDHIYGSRHCWEFMIICFVVLSLLLLCEEFSSHSGPILV